MNRPAASEILKDSQSTYSLVIAVAKRARDIAVECEANETILIDKPVKMAVDEFATRKYTLQESSDV